ncbi:hypothetical protein [Zunongwangia profunda]|uniref:hypothetical protein n=1 Tax=Zunongwangia profunda TaxID=398743 RepID=UPI001D187436|nr:hypothetical protein [Zunongwangia profunda]MCC4228398.1 hypothetical protein [Zunongwangia profunda]
MKNLKIENKHLLPEPWYAYPVLKKNEFEVIKLTEKKTTYGAEIRVGIQDGVWTLGYSFLGSGCNPGRKWGEFKSREDAINYFINENLPKLEEMKRDPSKKPYMCKDAEINEIIKNLIVLKVNLSQLSLF